MPTVNLNNVYTYTLHIYYIIHYRIINLFITKLNLTNRFCIYCGRGKLQEAMRLFKYNSQSIDDDTMDFAFKWALNNGHIDILNWIFSIRPNIIKAVNCDMQFMHACRHNYIAVAKFIRKQNYHRYKLIIKNGKIRSYYIKIKNTEILECVICLDKMSDTLTGCGHQYCEKCIKRWMKTNNTCPLCSARLNIMDFKKLV